jgi:collagenase-like PrtC family protease
MKDKSKIELLSPAGNLASLKAAIVSGANAVYLGLGKFNARENAANFNETNFSEAIKLAKSNHVKTFLTANTLIKNSELNDFFNQIKFAYQKGIDAVIIQDPGFINVIKNSFPDLHIHISTQAGVMNSLHANLFSNIERINLARELNKKNIELIRKNYKKELEIFVHGALCTCVSGSCLFSSLLGGRSGNRGKCAQPCRKLYNNAYLLSTKELCLIEHVPEIIKLGIDSIKIEGRMRTPFYVASTTSNYRKSIDSYYSGRFLVTAEMKKQLQDAFSRDFTEGKFMEKFIFNLKQSSGSSRQSKQEYNPPVRDIKIEKREENPINLNIKENKSSGKQLIVRVYTEKQALIADKYADIICLDMFNENFEEIKNKISRPVYAVTPRIMFDSDLELIEKRIKEINPAGLFAGNLGIIKMNFNLPIILDYNSNCFNDLSLKYYQDKKTIPVVSAELSLNELEEFKNKDFIAFVHGKIRLMTLAHELIENRIKDYRGFYFYIKKIFNGAEILNEKELGLFNKLRSAVKSGINQFYIDTDRLDNFEDILKIYKDILDGKTPDASNFQKNYVLGWSKQGVL